MNKQAISKVGTFNINDNSNASYLQFGDRINYSTKAAAFAVLQTRPSIYAGEPMFSQYEIFQPNYRLDEIVKFQPIYIKVNKPLYLCEFPDVKVEKIVDHINVVISSRASSVLIGNGKRHYAYYKQKNIRQHL